MATTKQGWWNRINRTHGTAMNSDQWEEYNSDDNEEEEGWPAEDDDDKGHHQNMTRDQWNDTEGRKWMTAREHHQATRATATTTRGGGCPSCFNFYLFFNFNFPLFY
jgi:hypothetical protein